MTARRVHYARELMLETAKPRAMCGAHGNGIQYTTDKEAITCGSCRRLLGLDKPLLPEKYRQTKTPDYLKNWEPGHEIATRAIDSLIGRAFINAEAQIDDLCTKAAKAIADWEADDGKDWGYIGQNMADVLRGFISVLGKNQP